MNSITYFININTDRVSHKVVNHVHQIEPDVRCHIHAKIIEIRFWEEALYNGNIVTLLQRLFSSLSLTTELGKQFQYTETGERGLLYTVYT